MKISKIDLNKDLEVIKEIANSAFSTTPDSDLSDWFSFDEMVKIIKEDRGLCLKAENGGEVLGTIFANQESPINGKESLEKWVIILIAIDPNSTGKGIGTELLKTLEQELSQRAVKKLFVFTNKDDAIVINFYRKNGFVDAGYIEDYQYGKGNSAVFLLKYLNNFE